MCGPGHRADTGLFIRAVYFHMELLAPVEGLGCRVIGCVGDESHPFAIRTASVQTFLCRLLDIGKEKIALATFRIGLLCML